MLNAFMNGELLLTVNNSINSEFLLLKVNNPINGK